MSIHLFPYDADVSQERALARRERFKELKRIERFAACQKSQYPSGLPRWKETNDPSGWWLVLAGVVIVAIGLVLT